MKRNYRIVHLLLVIFLFVGYQSYSQGFLDKLKNKTEDKVLDEIFKDKKAKDKQSETPATEKDTDSPANTRGGGLTTTAPDVLKNISEAQSAWETNNYAGARYAVRQAILGIEMEIGRNILNELPESIDDLPKDPDSDRVTSTGIGFVGLVIERIYQKGDKQFSVTVGNDGALLSSVNMYLATGTYSQSSSDQNYKQTKFKDEEAVIEYDEYSGYTLSVPFGQSSILVAKGINFDTEDEFMSASENININNIKKHLGEQ